MKITVLIAFMALLSSCATTHPVGGALYSDVAGPVTTTHLPKGPLRGEACATSWLGLVALGDASIAASAKNGGMNIVSHVDSTGNSILFIKNTYCTITYGYLKK